MIRFYPIHHFIAALHIPHCILHCHGATTLTQLLNFEIAGYWTKCHVSIISRLEILMDFTNINFPLEGNIFDFKARIRNREEIHKEQWVVYELAKNQMRP